MLRAVAACVGCLAFGAAMALAHLAGHAIEAGLVAVALAMVALVVWDGRAARRTPPVAPPPTPRGNTVRVQELAEQTILAPPDETPPE